MYDLNEIKNCLICERKNDSAELIPENSRKQKLMIVCKYCGMYILPQSWRGYSYIRELDKRTKKKLTFCLKNNELDYAKSITKDDVKNKMLKAGKVNFEIPEKFSQYQIRIYGYKPPIFSNEHDIKKYISKRDDFPESLEERMISVLMYFYKNEGIDGKFINIPEEDYNLIGLANSDDLHRIAINLKRKDMIIANITELGLESATLSVDGQLHIENLIKTNKQKAVIQFSKKKERNKDLLNETKTLLHKYPNIEKPYLSGLEKYSKGIYKRNLLDDMRLSLELLLKEVLNNNKSLENQVSEIGRFQKAKGSSSELTNMFVKLVDYYSKYHNSYIKHNDNVKLSEIDIIIDLTSSFIKFLIKIYEE